MKTNIYGKNIEITPGIKTAINESLVKIEKYIKNKYGEEKEISIDIVLEVKKKRHKVEETLSINGKKIRAEEDYEDMYASITSCAKKLEIQLKKYDKLKVSKKQKEVNNRVEDIKDSRSKEDSEILEEIKITKRKEFKVETMSPEEAIEEMILLGHDFYLFKNPITNTTDIVYKRKDDTYGLINTK